MRWRYEGSKEGNVDAVMDVRATLDKMARRGFPKEVTFELRPGEKRVSIYG